MQNSSKTAGLLSLIALALFIGGTFMVWSNPDGVTRGPFVGDYNKPEMALVPVLGVIGALLGAVFGRKRMGRGLGIGVFVLGLLGTGIVTALLLAAGFDKAREGLYLLELASLLTMASGLVGIVRPARKDAASPASAEHATVAA